MPSQSRSNEMDVGDMAASKRRLAFFLSELRCPAFLTVSEERLGSSSHRRTLLLWLYAVYKKPAQRNASEDQWARDEPTAEQLMQWLRLLLGGGENDVYTKLLEATELPAAALEQLLVVVETVHGRVLMESRGEAQVLLEASGLVADLAANHESVFDDRCEIFPLSIQMMASELRHGVKNSSLVSLFDDDIATLQRQLEALDSRITSANDRVQALHSVAVDSPDGAQQDSRLDNELLQSLSAELGRYLQDCADLIDRVTRMFKGDLAPWMDPPKPNLTGVGDAAASAYESIDHVLRFLENSQSFANADRDKRQVQATQDVSKDCQELIDRISPGLRDQLHTLEMALAAARQR